MFAGFPNHAVSSANYVWDHHFFFPFIFWDKDIGFDKYSFESFSHTDEHV